MSTENSNSPFGDEDASRSKSVTPIEVTQDATGFVNMKSITKSGITNEGDGRYRVLVGKKGSGKTLYLRRAHINLKENSIYREDSSSLILEKYDENRPQTDLIIRFSQYFNGEFLTEKWRELWRRAIWRSIASHIQYSERLKTERRLLSYDFFVRNREILSKAGTPVTIFSQVKEIIENLNGPTNFDKFCNNILWTEFEFHMGRILHNSKELYFFVDAIDQEYQHAPMYWMRAQKGLFYSVMQFLRDPISGGKIHILISIRDHVYSSVLQSEHATRYIGSEYISILKWNSETALFLLNQKLKYLDDKYFIHPRNKTIEGWLGMEWISNGGRHISEKISDYIIRHTRSIPRDIILIGNGLSRKIELINSKELGQENWIVELKKVIHDRAIKFGEEQLRISANHLASNLTPGQAVELGVEEMFSSRYTAEKEYLNLSKIFYDKISDIIRSIGKDRFSKQELMEAKEYSKSIFKMNTDLNLFDILWQNCLIGYTTVEGISQFFSESSANFTLPTYAHEYVFHSILIDTLDLSPIGLPVMAEF